MKMNGSDLTKKARDSFTCFVLSETIRAGHLLLFYLPAPEASEAVLKGLQRLQVNLDMRS